TSPVELTNAVAIDAGNFHSLALRSNGTVVGWGLSGYGAIPPAGLTNVLMISAGGGHSLALKNDTTVVGWGDNTFGQTTPPAGLSAVMMIAGGDWHSLALKSLCPATAPSGLVANAVSWNRINLAWTDNSTSEDGFKI